MNYAKKNLLFHNSYINYKEHNHPMIDFRTYFLIDLMINSKIKNQSTNQSFSHAIWLSYNPIRFDQIKPMSSQIKSNLIRLNASPNAQSN